MKKIAIIGVLIALMAGCRTTEIPVIEPWEGRYSTVEEFKLKTEGIELKDK